MNKLLLTVTLVVLAFPAQADLGAAEQAYAKGDYATALKALQPLAEAGDPAAQYRLGEMYLKGQGIKKDEAWAVTWLRRSWTANSTCLPSRIWTTQPRGRR